jgi:hypothetical protein
VLPTAKHPSLFFQIIEHGETLAPAELLHSNSILLWFNEAFLERHCEPGTRPGYSGEKTGALKLDGLNYSQVGYFLWVL